jgi:hypothetical protein
MRRSPIARYASAGLLVLAVGLTGCGSSRSLGSSVTLQCRPKASGALCIRVISHGATVDDVIGYLSASKSPLAGSTWRLVLTAYGCNPGVNSISRCVPSGSFAGPTRLGPPPQATSCRTATVATVVSAPGCDVTLAQEMATHGDWAGFFGFAQGQPHVFAARVWLCVSEQVYSNGAWQQPVAAEAPSPLRACSTVG